MNSKNQTKPGSNRNTEGGLSRPVLAVFCNATAEKAVEEYPDAVGIIFW